MVTMETYATRGAFDKGFEAALSKMVRLKKLLRGALWLWASRCDLVGSLSLIRCRSDSVRMLCRSWRFPQRLPTQMKRRQLKPMLMHGVVLSASAATWPTKMSG